MKVPSTTLPGIPTEEKPLWERIQEKSREIMLLAVELGTEPAGTIRQESLLTFLRAEVGVFNQLTHGYPYRVEISTELVHDPDHDQDVLCQCGHPYYRHFDTYDDMNPVGCKYCPCFTWTTPNV